MTTGVRRPYDAPPRLPEPQKRSVEEEGQRALRGHVEALGRKHLPHRNPLADTPFLEADDHPGERGELPQRVAVDRYRAEAALTARAAEKIG